MSISVIIPVFNGERFIAEAIDSVLAQTVSADEIIVIDDGSTDNSAQIIMNYGNQIKYFYKPNEGIALSYKKGVSLANSEFITFLDQDDIFLPTKLENSLQVFRENPKLMVVIAQWRYFFSTETLKNNFIYPQEIEKNHYGMMGGCLFKKNIFNLVNAFDSEIDGHSDVDLFLQIKHLNIPKKKIEDLALLHRYHENNATKSYQFINRTQSSTLKMLYNSIKLRRAQNKK